jgi:hypothetical protein
MEFRLLTAIEDWDQSLRAFQMLKENLSKGARIYEDHLVGWQGGSGALTAYWLPSNRIWAVLEPSPPNNKKVPRHRFWNCFGLDDPARRSMLSITVELNPPHEGENRRVAGLFARDEANRIYVAHTGKVGGGRLGIGQKSFREFFRDADWDEIGTSRGKREALVLGPIDATDFADQVAAFVHKVAEFKENISKGWRQRAT